MNISLTESRRNKACLIPANSGKTFGQLLQRTCEKIIALAKPFAEEKGKSFQNLLSLNSGIPVGQWRDSTDGLGGGRYPYDVNTTLMPAALRAIATLVRAGAFGEEGQPDRTNGLAEIWESSSPDFFHVSCSSADCFLWCSVIYGPCSLRIDYYTEERGSTAVEGI